MVRARREVRRRHAVARRGARPDGPRWSPRLRDSSWRTRVEFHCGCSGSPTSSWPRAQRAARRRRAWRSGIMHDLAVGVHPRGRRRLGAAVTCSPAASRVGAPPDMYNQQGQNWSQPPWRPDAAGRAALRAVPGHAAHGAAARGRASAGRPRHRAVPAVVDPRGRRLRRAAPTSATTTRRSSASCALEAQRAGAVVIGEDLGVVEPWVRDYLAERGVLGTSVLWFERDEDGAAAAARALPAAWPGDGDHARPAADRRVPGGRARRHPRAPRPADRTGRRRTRAAALAERDADARRPAPSAAWSGTTRRSARSSRRCTATSWRRRPCCSASRWPTRWGSGGRRTSRGPTRSTRTGGAAGRRPGDVVLLEDLFANRARCCSRRKGRCRDALSRS